MAAWGPVYNCQRCMTGRTETNKYESISAHTKNGGTQAGDQTGGGGRIVRRENGKWGLEASEWLPKRARLVLIALHRFHEMALPQFQIVASEFSLVASRQVYFGHRNFFDAIRKRQLKQTENKSGLHSDKNRLHILSRQISIFVAAKCAVIDDFLYFCGLPLCLMTVLRSYVW